VTIFPSVIYVGRVGFYYIWIWCLYHLGW